MRRKRKIITSKIKRGSLINYALENVKKESFTSVKKELKDVLKDKLGIYALYKRGKVVKVGLGTKIYYRLRGHADSKKIDWDVVGLYIIDEKYLELLRDLETAVNRIAKPKYSYQKGRVKYEHYLERILKKKVNERKALLRKKSEITNKKLGHLKDDIKQIESFLKP